MAHRPVPPETPEDRARFDQNIGSRAPGECHPWTGTLFAEGYGAFTLNGRTYRAHRVIFAWTFGDTDRGLDHECHDPDKCDGGFGCPHRACVNPDHLVAKPQKENVLRGGGPSAKNAKKELTIHGNEFDYVDPRGWRGSKKERDEAVRRYHESHRDEINARKRAKRVRVVYDERPCSACGNPFTPKRSTGKVCARRECINARRRRTEK